MAESIAMLALVWIAHAVLAGLPAITAYRNRIPCRWAVCLALVAGPFWALLLAQGFWPVGGMSSYLLRLLLLTAVVFVAELIEVSLSKRSAPIGRHMLLLAGAILAVVPIQLMVPSLSD
jgi:hypothetical protein